MYIFELAGRQDSRGTKKKPLASGGFGKHHANRAKDYRADIDITVAAIHHEGAHLPPGGAIVRHIQLHAHLDLGGCGC